MKITIYMRTKVRLIPRTRVDIAWIKRNGIRGWLTWATVDQACELEPLRWWQKLARKLIK